MAKASETKTIIAVSQSGKKVHEYHRVQKFTGRLGLHKAEVKIVNGVRLVVTESPKGKHRRTYTREGESFQPLSIRIRRSRRYPLGIKVRFIAK